MEYINYLPVYYALEEGILPLKLNWLKVRPRLNRLFLDGELEVTSLSSIEYAVMLTVV